MSFAEGMDGASVQRRTFFIENQGQHDPQVKYYVQGVRGRVFLTPTEIVFDFVQSPASRAVRPDAPGQGDEDSAAPDSQRLVFRMCFDGANPQPEIAGREERPGKVNYLVGSSENWKSNIPTFAEVAYLNVYEGIDMVFSLPGNNLRYAIHLGQADDLAKVRFSYEGVKELGVNDEGNLVLSTDFGDFVEKPPTVWRESVALAVRFEKLDENQVGLVED